MFPTLGNAPTGDAPNPGLTPATDGTKKRAADEAAEGESGTKKRRNPQVYFDIKVGKRIFTHVDIL